MRNFGQQAAIWIGTGLSLLVAACSSSGNTSTPPPPPKVYVLTVDSTSPASGVAITASPADNNNTSTGTTSFTLTYNTGTSVTLTAPATSGSNTFSSWTGCTTASTVTCNVTLSANTTVTANYAAPVTYVLTVDSTNPASGVVIGAAPADNNNTSTGTTSFTLTYNTGTSVTLTAPATSGSNTFSSWTGCTTASTVTCTVTLSANTTVTANYAVPVPPVTYLLAVDSTNPASGVVIGAAPADNNNTSTGTTSFTLTYNTGTSVTLTAPGSSGSNNFSSWTGCTTTSTVTCTVTLNANTTVTANYATPAVSVSVDANANQHAIDPRIYGGAFLKTSDITASNFSSNRWGGNNESDYNWQQDANNLDNDWYFETYADSTPIVPGGAADSFIATTQAANLGSQPYITVPMLPYVASLPATPNTFGCSAAVWSFSIAKYGAQTVHDPYCSDAGNGISTAAGNPYITGNNPLDAYVPNTVAIQQAWLQHLIGKWGNSQSSTGIKYYILDNEPSLWKSTHRDVHPAGTTYDELWTGIQAYGGAIKAADPNAYVIGPEEWIWWAMWESGHDQSTGTGAGSDYATHNNTYWYPWLLQQLAAYKAANGHSLIDGLSVHCYTDAASNWNVATREMWDPTYKDPNWEGTLGLNGGVLDFIPLMHQWINAAFPNGGGPDIGCTEWSNSGTGTLTDVTYQADMLGIFGYYGFNFANYWGSATNPIALATQMYRNYDGNYSTFGDTSVSATVANPDNLSAYAAVRSSDGALTVMVINKVTSSTPVTVNLANFASGGTAQAYQVSSFTQTSITSLGSVTVTNHAIGTTVPSQSITLFVIPKT